MKNPSATTGIRRAATRADCAVIAELAETIWREHYTPIIGKPQVDYMLRHFQSAAAISDQMEAGMHYYLLEHEGRPAGYFAFEKQGDHLFLSKIYVLGNLRGKGLGKSAMAFISGEARQGCCQAITLTVNRHNSASIAAYERMGFRLQDAVIKDIGGGFVMDDYRMRLEL